MIVLGVDFRIYFRKLSRTTDTCRGCRRRPYPPIAVVRNNVASLRLQVHVRKGDASLIFAGSPKRSPDPARAAETRALLRERFCALQAKGLKELLAAAPLEGIDLTRERDLGRDVALSNI